MRWKLLVGLAITWFGLGITGLFQHAGIIPLDTPLFWTLMGPAILDCLRNFAGIRSAQRLAGQMGFAEIARADAKFFDRLYGEGIRRQGANGSHTMLVHEMGILTCEEH